MTEDAKAKAEEVKAQIAALSKIAGDDTQEIHARLLAAAKINSIGLTAMLNRPGLSEGLGEVLEKYSPALQNFGGQIREMAQAVASAEGRIARVEANLQMLFLQWGLKYDVNAGTTAT